MLSSPIVYVCFSLDYVLIFNNGKSLENGAVFMNERNIGY